MQERLRYGDDTAMYFEFITASQKVAVAPVLSRAAHVSMLVLILVESIPLTSLPQLAVCGLTVKNVAMYSPLNISWNRILRMPIQINFPEFQPLGEKPQ